MSVRVGIGKFTNGYNPELYGYKKTTKQNTRATASQRPVYNKVKWTFTIKVWTFSQKVTSIGFEPIPLLHCSTNLRGKITNHLAQIIPCIYPNGDAMRYYFYANVWTSNPTVLEFFSRQMYVLSSAGSKDPPFVHCSTNHLIMTNHLGRMAKSSVQKKLH